MHQKKKNQPNLNISLRNDVNLIQIDMMDLVLWSRLADPDPVVLVGFGSGCFERKESDSDQNEQFLQF